MVSNIYKHGPNEASNTNVKLPDLKWQNIAKKNDQKWAKLPQNGQK